MHTEIFLSDGMQILPCLGESLHVITAICFHLLGALANLTEDMRAAPQLKGYKSCLLAINDGALVAEVPDWMRLILSPALLPMRVCAFLHGAWICQCSAVAMWRARGVFYQVRSVPDLRSSLSASSSVAEAALRAKPSPMFCIL